MLTHRSRGSDTSAADFVIGSMLAIMIVSERVPEIGSSSRLSTPRSRMLTRSRPVHSGTTFLTTLAMLDERAGAGAESCEAGRLASGVVVAAGPVKVTVPVTLNPPAPQTTPPTTNAQNVATANRGGLGGAG